MNNLEQWETTFQRRVMFWTGDCGVRAADVVLQIPELVRLVSALADDACLPTSAYENELFSAERVCAVISGFRM